MYPETDWEWDGEEFGEWLDEESEALDWESSIAHDIQTMWTALPPDIKQMLIAYARNMWKIRAALLPMLVGRAYNLMRRYRYTPAAAIQQAGRQLGLRPRRRRSTGKPGMSPVKVKSYLRRRQQRLPARRVKRRFGVRRY